MKLSKSLYLVTTGFMAFCLMPTSVLADDTSNAKDSQAYDCHYVGAKVTDDMKAEITKEGSTFTWSDEVGESAPITILPNRVISFDYTYKGKEGSTVSGKMTFKVQDDGTLDGTYSDSFDSGKITCTEIKK